MSDTLRLVVDELSCKGHGLCFFGWPDLFDLDDDGIAVPLLDQVPEGRIEEVRRAIAACPERAIGLSDQ